jgi:hypothetical protein
MDERVNRRNFIGSLGVAATVAATAYVAAPRAAGAAAKPKRFPLRLSRSAT